jgi:hypothetical protein
MQSDTEAIEQYRDKQLQEHLEPASEKHFNEVVNSYAFVKLSESLAEISRYCYEHNLNLDDVIKEAL